MGGHFIILVLRPALERVIMAFVTIKSCGKEEMGGIFHCVLRCSQNLIIGGRRIFLVGTRGCENFFGKLVIGSVFADFLFYPIAQ